MCVVCKQTPKKIRYSTKYKLHSVGTKNVAIQCLFTINVLVFDAHGPSER